MLNSLRISKLVPTNPNFCWIMFKCFFFLATYIYFSQRSIKYNNLTRGCNLLRYAGFRQSRLLSLGSVRFAIDYQDPNY